MTRDEVIIDYIGKHGPVGGLEVAVALEQKPYHIPRTTTFQLLSQMYKFGRLHRTGSARCYVYNLPQSGKLPVLQNKAQCSNCQHWLPTCKPQYSTKPTFHCKEYVALQEKKVGT